MYDLLSKAKNADQYNALLLSNKDILYQEGDYVKSSFNSLSTALLNREGMVSIGGNVHYFAQDKTIIAPNVEKAREAIKTGVNPAGTVKLLKSAKDVKNAGARMAITSCGKLDKKSQSPDGQREAHIEVSILRREILYYYDPYTGNKYQVDYYAHVLGSTVKRNFWGSWVSYNTSNDLYSRFQGTLSVTVFDPAWYTRLDSYSYAVNEPVFSSYGSSITYDKVIKSYDNVWEWQLQEGMYNYSSSIAESSPSGVYTSGGVPNGVIMQCP